MERKQVRRERYHQLKKVGYTAKEATAYKCLSNRKVDELIKLKKKQNAEISAIRKG